MLGTLRKEQSRSNPPFILRKEKSVPMKLLIKVIGKFDTK